MPRFHPTNETLRRGPVPRLILALGLGLALGGCGRHREQVPAGPLINAGWTSFRLGEFKQAEKSFDAAREQAPEGSQDQLAALFGAATLWNLRRPGENPDRAATLYREVITKSPTNDLAAWSGLALARMKVIEAGVEWADAAELNRAYQDVIDRFPFHAAGEEAFLFQQAAVLERTPPEAVVRAVLQKLESFLAEHPQSPFKSTAWRLIAQGAETLGLKDKLLDAALQEWKTAEVDPLNPIADRSLIYMRIANVAEYEAGDFAVAREFYQKLIAEYPTDQRVFLARQELKRMDEVEASLRAGSGAGKGAP